MYIAHPFLAVPIANHLVKDKERLNNNFDFYLAVSIVFSILPDLDIFLALMSDTNSHHSMITHTPFFHLFISCVFIILIQLFFKSRRTILLLYVKLFASNTLFHILMDTFAGNIMLLWPFRDKTVQLLSLNPILSVDNTTIQYFLTPILLLQEIVIIILSILTFERLKRSYNLTFSKYTLAIFTTASITLTLFFALL